RSTTGQVDDDLLSEISMRGGSTDSAVADVTVAPVRISPSPAVMMVTPPPNFRRACLRLPASAGLSNNGRIRASLNSVAISMLMPSSPSVWTTGARDSSSETAPVDKHFLSTYIL